MSESTRAVFLSYAREDTGVARRMADALRGFGVEVWFDQNELRGGEAWDAKIRQQIRTCALFMPVISAATQARGEGYFRREWKIAVDRSHDMHEGVPFIVPVVIDETAESAALVPDPFMRVQWTRLPSGMPTPQFVEQVKRLLEPRTSTPPMARPTVAGVVDPGPASAKPATAQRRSGGIWGVAAAVVLVVAAAAGWFALHKPALAPVVVETKAAPAETKPAPVAAPAINEKSIAVLPFENMSEEKDGAFFADGMHEDILTNLALVRQLHVVSRTSVMQYRATTKSIRQIGDELGVAYILEGSVRRAGNKVRVTGQLINARTDGHVWAKAYDRDITDIFAIQAELSQAIASALAAALSPQEKLLIEHRPTENVAAYDLYLKARELLGESSDTSRITELLESAVELDPRFAAAWAELGRWHAYNYFNDFDRTDERLARAKTAIDQAVRLAPDDPAVIEKLGDYYYYGFRDYPHASEQYQRLAELRPGDAGVARSLGLIYRRQARWAESLANFRRASELEPGNAEMHKSFIEMLFSLHRYDEAEVLAHRMATLHPDQATAQAYVAFVAFAARGSVAETKTLGQLSLSPTQQSLLISWRKALAALAGDAATDVALDREQRYCDEVGFPHWQQDMFAAMALDHSGDHAAALARVEPTLATMKGELERQPSSAALWASMATAYQIKGDAPDALRCAQRATELRTISSDAVDGPGFAALYASCLATAGQTDRALAELAKLLRTPFGVNLNELSHGFYTADWRPLRADPRFQALLADPKNNAPLF